MRRGGFSLFLVLGLASASAHAEGQVGVGIVAGDPTGFTLKSRFTPMHALQLHVGIGIGRFDNGRLTLVADYLIHADQLFKDVSGSGFLVPYAGLGAKLGLRESSVDPVALAARVPIGVAFLFRKTPLELFGEVAIGIHALPAVAPLIDGGIGLRWYF